MQNVLNKQGTSETARDKNEDYVSSAIQEGEQKVRDIISDAKKKLSQGGAQLKEVASAVDKQLHENPWPIVGGVAASCLLLGFILGKSK